MNITDFSCIYLLFCLSSNPSNVEECPANCQCYSAPEGGLGADTAITLKCNSITSATVSEFYTKISHKNKSINTLVLDEVKDEDLDNFGSLQWQLSINNLVIHKLANPSNKPKARVNLFQLIKSMSVQDLQVLTVHDTIQSETLNIMFIIEMIKLFPSLKALHMEGGSFPTIKYSWCPQSDTELNDWQVNSSLVSVTMDNIGVTNLDLFCLKYHTSIRMVTITRNSISDFPIRESDTLWYLDLRDNHIELLPDHLELPSLLVLKLGHNRIHTINGDSIRWLTQKLREFSFYGIGTDDPQNNYLLVSCDNKWIIDCLSGANNGKNPVFFRESLAVMYCKVNDSRTIKCVDVEQHYFETCPPPTTPPTLALAEWSTTYLERSSHSSGSLSTESSTRPEFTSTDFTDQNTLIL